MTMRASPQNAASTLERRTPTLPTKRHATPSCCTPGTLDPPSAHQQVPKRHTQGRKKAVRIHRLPKGPVNKDKSGHLGGSAG